MRLDAKMVAGLTLPDGKSEQVYWDRKLRGFGLRLRRRGERLHKTPGEHAKLPTATRRSCPNPGRARRPARFWPMWRSAAIRKQSASPSVKRRCEPSAPSPLLISKPTSASGGLHRIG
jgi:hypothetical protein